MKGQFSTVYYRYFFKIVGINVPLKLMVPLLGLQQAESDALVKEIKNV